MSASNSYPAAADCDEDPGVVELTRDLLAAHLSPLDPLGRLQLIRYAVLKFHQPVMLNSWHKDYAKTKADHPIMNNMKSSSLDLVITLLCAEKNAIDLIHKETYNFESYFTSHSVLVTALVMSQILAGRNKFIAYHLQKNMSAVIHIFTEMNVMVSDIVDFPLLVSKPCTNSNLNVWKRVLAFPSYSQLKESIPEDQCAVCLTQDITDHNFAILDNCRHIFCLPCISRWFKLK